MLNYGLVGLGNLGEKIARNLIKKGFVVKVYDKDQAKINKLTKIGAIASLSPAEVAQDVDGLITCLPSPKISTEVISIYSFTLYVSLENVNVLLNQT